MHSKNNYAELIYQTLEKYEDDFIYGPQLTELVQRLEAVEYSIVVVGQFSVGKSALLNALLGEEVLVARRKEATKVLTKIKTIHRPEDKRIQLHYKDGRCETIQIQSAQELDQYTTFQGREITDELALVEVYWPVQFLNDELTLIDTPGANSLTESAFQVTKEALTEAAAVLYLFNGQKGMDKTDYQLLQSYKENEKEVFLVATHTDALTESEWQQVEEHVQSHLQQKQIIYPVSSLLALNGKINNDSEMIDSSNVLQLESALKEFMEKARYKESSMRSIIHDYHIIMEEIELVEADEEEREQIEKKQRHLRYERLVAITRENYNGVEHYGLKLLNHRLDNIGEGSLPGHSELKRFEKKYRQQFREVFLGFAKKAQHLIVKPDTLYNLYEENLKKFDQYFRQWTSDIELLRDQTSIQLKNSIESDDQHFIELMDQMKKEVTIDWTPFEEKLKELDVLPTTFHFDNTKVDEAFEDFYEYHQEVTDELKKERKKKKELQRALEKEKSKFQLTEIDYQEEILAQGAAPEIEEREEKKRKWIFFSETKVIYDDSKLKKWQKRRKALKERFEEKQKEFHQNMEKLITHQENLEEKVEELKEELTLELEREQERLQDIVISSLDEESSFAAEQAKRYADEIYAEWKHMIREYYMYERKHIERMKQLFNKFMEEVKEKEIKKIKVI